jgi:hypothetical protein
VTNQLFDSDLTFVTLNFGYLRFASKMADDSVLNLLLGRLTDLRVIAGLSILASAIWDVSQNMIAEAANKAAVRMSLMCFSWIGNGKSVTAFCLLLMSHEIVLQLVCLQLITSVSRTEESISFNLSSWVDLRKRAFMIQLRHASPSVFESRNAWHLQDASWMARSLPFVYLDRHQASGGLALQKLVNSSDRQASNPTFGITASDPNWSGLFLCQPLKVAVFKRCSLPVSWQYWFEQFLVEPSNQDQGWAKQIGDRFETESANYDHRKKTPCDSHRSAIGLNWPIVSEESKMNCARCGKTTTFLSGELGLCVDCMKANRAGHAKETEPQRKRAADGGSQHAIEPSKEATASGVGLTTGVDNIASWERRYPNLSTYLLIGTVVNQMSTLLAGIAIFFFTMKEGASIFYGIGAGIVLVIYYIGTMAGIEFIKVICSIEQECVLARLDRRNGTRAVR